MCAALGLLDLRVSVSPSPPLFGMGLHQFTRASLKEGQGGHKQMNTGVKNYARTISKVGWSQDFGVDLQG